MYKFKSLIVVLILVSIMAVIGIMVSKGSITGASVANTISCYNNQDCDDHIQKTEDICKNPGTINSICVNKEIID